MTRPGGVETRTGFLAPACPRCHGALDAHARNGVCGWCLPAPAEPASGGGADIGWEFDQHPLTAETQRAIALLPAYAVAERLPEGWVVSILAAGLVIGRFTPDQARLLAFDLIQMALACEGQHAAQVGRS